MRNTSFLLALLLTVVIYSPISDAGGWYEYKSDNFTVYSDATEKRTKNLLQDMERFRNAVLFITGLEDRPENQKLQIFHFGSYREFKEFSNNRQTVGFYRNTLGGPVIFSQTGSRGLGGKEIMYHEYVHHLMRERSRMRYPRWYSEGFAELLASAETGEDRVVVGGVPEWRVSALSGNGWEGGTPMTVNELLEPELEKNSSRYWNSYYATAWLFTHYLQFGGSSDGTSYREQTRGYLSAVSRGADPRLSFEQHFGKTADEMQEELSRYKGDRLYGYKFDIPAYEKEIRRRKLDNNERYYLLAYQALNIGNDELALEYLEKSRGESAGWQTNLSLRAVLENHKDNMESAAAAAARIESEPIRDYRLTTNLAHYYTDRLESLKKAGQWDDALYQKALEYGQSAIEQNPAHIPAYRYLWTAQQHKGDEVGALRTMMLAFQQESGNLYLSQTIGFYLASIERADLARPFLESVVAWSHAGEVRRKAKDILDSLNGESSPKSTEE